MGNKTEASRMCAMCGEPITDEGVPFGIDGDAHPECETEWFRQHDAAAEQQRAVDARLLVAAYRTALSAIEAVAPDDGMALNIRTTLAEMGAASG